MKIKFSCPQCDAKMSVARGVDEVQCPICRVAMVPDSEPEAEMEESPEPPTADGEGRKSFPSIKVAKPISSKFMRSSGLEDRMAQRQKTDPSSVTTITKTATPVSIPAAKKGDGDQISEAEAEEKSREIIASARRQAEALARDLIDRAEEEAQGILIAADEEVQPRIEARLKEAGQKAEKMVEEGRRKAEEEARKIVDQAKADAESKREEMAGKIREEIAGQMREKSEKLGRQAEEKLAAATRQAEEKLAAATRQAGEMREKATRQAGEMREKATRQAEEIKEAARKASEEEKRKAVDEARKSALKEAGKKLEEQQRKAAGEAEKIVEEARRKAREIDRDRGQTAAGAADQPGDGSAAAASPGKDDEAAKDEIRERKRQMDGYAKREAKFIMAGMSLGMLVLLYCLGVLALVDNLDSTLRTLTYGLVLIDLAMVAWLTMLIRGHYKKGNEALQAQRQRTRSRREERKNGQAPAQKADLRAAMLKRQQESKKVQMQNRPANDQAGPSKPVIVSGGKKSGKRNGKVNRKK